MPSNRPVTVVALPTFLKALKRLKRKYPGIGGDLRSLIDQLEDGDILGDQVQGVQHTVYKVRLRNSSGVRGKSGGFRIIYYIKTQEKLLLVYIYSKTERQDINSDEIRRMIEEYET